MPAYYYSGMRLSTLYTYIYIIPITNLVGLQILLYYKNIKSTSSRNLYQPWTFYTPNSIVSKMYKAKILEYKEKLIESCILEDVNIYFPLKEIK